MKCASPKSEPRTIVYESSDPSTFLSLVEYIFDGIKNMIEPWEIALIVVVGNVTLIFFLYGAFHNV